MKNRSYWDNMSTVKKIAMVIVMENDLQAAFQFYKTLGLKLAFHVPDRWAEFKINDLQIGLCPTTESVNLNRTGLVFEVADLENFYQTHKDTMSFLDKPVEAAHGIMASVQDPSGNILDLYQPTPEKIQHLAQKLQDDQMCCGGKSCGSEQPVPTPDLYNEIGENQQGCC